MARRSSPAPHAISHECGRCSRIHHGARPGPGWSDHPDFGKICNDCDEGLRLSAITGTPFQGKAA